MTVTHIVSEAGFHSALKTSILVIIDYYATWCGPCKKLAPELEVLAKKHPDVRFCKVDVDATGMDDVSASQKISAMPTIILYKRGKEVDRIVGASIAKIDASIARHKNV